MTTQQAKAILSLYRPETADAKDAYFCEARKLCEQNPELRRWFDDHCAVYQTLRAKLRETPVPEGLKEQILAERAVHVPGVRPRARILAVAALITLFVAIGIFWSSIGEKAGFPEFVQQSLSTALRGYGMDVETDNPEQVRGYLAQRNSPADYVLPMGLQKARVAGCVASAWQGKPVSMICFRSGKTLQPGQASDLWLFVAEKGTVRDAPASAQPVLSHIHTVATATWTDHGKTYLLMMEGDESDLQKFL